MKYFQLNSGKIHSIIIKRQSKKERRRYLLVFRFSSTLTSLLSVTGTHLNILRDVSPTVTHFFSLKQRHFLELINSKIDFLIITVLSHFSADHSFNLKCFLNFLSVKSYLTFQDKIIPSRNTLLSNAFSSEPSTCHLCSCTVYQNLLFLTAYSSIEYQHIFKLRYLSGINFFISPKLIQFH